MPKVLKRPLAEADLDEIWSYIAQDNPEAADRFLDKIEERSRTLAQLPNMASVVRNYAPGCAACRLAGAMDIDSFFSEDGP